MKRFRERLFATILLLLLPICQVLTFDPSPAGGGWLEVSKSGGFALVAAHEDFGKNLAREFTLEMWIYLKRYLEFGEVWILLHKEGSYLLTLRGHTFGPDGLIPFREPRIGFTYHLRHNGGGGDSSRSFHQDEIPLNRWHHIALVHDENGYLIYINGVWFGGTKNRPPLSYKNFELYIGGTDTNQSQLWNNEPWTQFAGGLIDEVRISDKARYPVKIEGPKIAVPQGRFESDENTLALWRFDGARAEWLEDSSGHGHTLTAVDLNYYGVEAPGKLPTIWGQVKKD